MPPAEDRSTVSTDKLQINSPACGGSGILAVTFSEEEFELVCCTLDTFAIGLDLVTLIV